MPDFNVRSDSVNVEQIMEQIRARIREKRGVDYTEAQIRELAAARLEQFIDPDKLHSNLLREFHRIRAEGDAPAALDVTIDESVLFETHRPWLRSLRKLLRPILKLFLNTKALAALSAEYSISPQHPLRRAGGEAGIRATRVRSAALRGDA